MLYRMRTIRHIFICLSLYNNLCMQKIFVWNVELKNSENCALPFLGIIMLSELVREEGQ